MPVWLYVLVAAVLIGFMCYVLWRERKDDIARDERYIQYLQAKAAIQYGVMTPNEWREMEDRLYFQQLVKVVEEARHDFLA